MPQLQLQLLLTNRSNFLIWHTGTHVPPLDSTRWQLVNPRQYFVSNWGVGYTLEYPSQYLIVLNRYAAPEPQEPHPSVIPYLHARSNDIHPADGEH